MNEINVIEPYRYSEMWAFDDPRVGLSAEPFVGGADTMIDRVTAGLPHADRGFVMVFSGNPFPGHQFRLEWRREEGTGNVYYSRDSMPKAGSAQLSFATLKRGRPRFMFR
jgi:Family of unknown function (DUF6717)